MAQARLCGERHSREFIVTLGVVYSERRSDFGLGLLSHRAQEGPGLIPMQQIPNRAHCYTLGQLDNKNLVPKGWRTLLWRTRYCLLRCVLIWIGLSRRKLFKPKWSLHREGLEHKRPGWLCKLVMPIRVHEVEGVSAKDWGIWSGKYPSTTDNQTRGSFQKSEMTEIKEEKIKSKDE